MTVHHLGAIGESIQVSRRSAVATPSLLHRRPLWKPVATWRRGAGARSWTQCLCRARSAPSCSDSSRPRSSSLVANITPGRRGLAVRVCRVRRTVGAVPTATTSTAITQKAYSTPGWVDASPSGRRSIPMRSPVLRSPARWSRRSSWSTPMPCPTPSVPRSTGSSRVASSSSVAPHHLLRRAGSVGGAPEVAPSRPRGRIARPGARRRAFGEPRQYREPHASHHGEPIDSARSSRPGDDRGDCLVVGRLLATGARAPARPRAVPPGRAP